MVICIIITYTIWDDQVVVDCDWTNPGKNFHFWWFTGYPAVNRIPSWHDNVVCGLSLEFERSKTFKDLWYTVFIGKRYLHQVVQKWQKSLTRFGQWEIVHLYVALPLASVGAGQSMKHGGGLYPPTSVLFNVYWIRLAVPKMKWCTFWR